MGLGLELALLLALAAVEELLQHHLLHLRLVREIPELLAHLVRVRGRVRVRVRVTVTVMVRVRATVRIRARVRVRDRVRVRVRIRVRVRDSLKVPPVLL